MGKVFNMPKVQTDQYGKTVVQGNDFKYLIGMNIKDIIMFDDGTDELLEQGVTILPRHHYFFVGTVDGVHQFKPYEYDKYRIIVSTYKDIIVDVE